MSVLFRELVRIEILSSGIAAGDEHSVIGPEYRRIWRGNRPVYHHSEWDTPDVGSLSEGDVLLLTIK